MSLSWRTLHIWIRWRQIWLSSLYRVTSRGRGCCVGRQVCAGESRSEVQSGQLPVQYRNPVSFGAGFHTLCNGESFVVCGCAFMVAVKCGESVSQDDLPLHEIGINGNCLFGCETSRVGL